MRLYLDYQMNTAFQPLPHKKTVKRWLKTALGYVSITGSVELTIRCVDTTEIQALNQQFRHKDYPTNVLSFPFETPEHWQGPIFLGDVIICPSVIAEQAQAQQKNFYHHLTHIMIHGVLHLLGFDHIESADADIMESTEIEILQQLHIGNPYIDKIDSLLIHHD